MARLRSSAPETTTGATAQSDEPAHGNAPATRSVWYRWKATFSGRLVLSTCSSFQTLGSDTTLGVYTGDKLGALTPIAQGDDVFTVLPATLPEFELERRLADADAAVVMKIGRHLPKVRRALERAGLLDRAIYVERGTMANAAIMKLADKLDTPASYFAMVLVPGWETRP